MDKKGGTGGKKKEKQIDALRRQLRRVLHQCKKNNKQPCASHTHAGKQRHGEGDK
jgi:hypothetical protein